MLSIVASGNLRTLCKILETNYERARSTPPELEKPARNIGGEAGNIWCLFLEFWRGGRRSLIVFLEDFAKESLITFATIRDNVLISTQCNADA